MHTPLLNHIKLAVEIGFLIDGLKKNQSMVNKIIEHAAQNKTNIQTVEHAAHYAVQNLNTFEPELEAMLPKLHKGLLRKVKVNEDVFKRTSNNDAKQWVGQNPSLAIGTATALGGVGGYLAHSFLSRKKNNESNNE